MKGGKFVHLRLLDHLIISEEGYFSFLDEGMFELLRAEAAMMLNGALG